MFWLFTPDNTWRRSEIRPFEITPRHTPEAIDKYEAAGVDDPIGVVERNGVLVRS